MTIEKDVKKVISLSRRPGQDDKYYAALVHSAKNENHISGSQPSLLKIHHPFFPIMH